MKFIIKVIYLCLSLILIILFISITPEVANSYHSSNISLKVNDNNNESIAEYYIEKLLNKNDLFPDLDKNQCSHHQQNAGIENIDIHIFVYGSSSELLIPITLSQELMVFDDMKFPDYSKDINSPPPDYIF